jgi:RelA/SpoT family (p)ppGpp synthetase
LHTVLFGPFGVPIEVQIRTNEMDDVAEAGIAAHWLYKSGSSNEQKSAQKRTREWLKNILAMQTTAGNPQEFLENVRIDLFPDSVYNFTPKGKIVELPRGATAVDFAYAIHTDVGNRCVGVRIDRRLAPLGTSLTTGQTVEIINAPGARPDPAWLNFAITAKARSNIRHFLKNLQKNEATSLGKRLLVRELKLLSVIYDEIDPQKMEKTLEEHHLENEELLLQEIGLGNRMAKLIARQLIDEQDVPELPDRQNSKDNQPLMIKGTEGMVINFPKCCLPIPGDKIIGFVTAGRGIVVHHQSCSNVAEYRNHPEKWISVVWESRIESDFQTHITIEVTNQRGMLAKLASTISEEGANIVHIEMKDRDDRYTTLKFIIEVSSRIHLARIMRKVRIIKNVARISRR